MGFFAWTSVFGEPFVPTDVSGTTVWLRSDVVTSSGGVVSAWPDQSGNGNNLTQATVGKRPVLTPSVINGHASVDFDGVDDFLRTTFALVQPEHIWIVCVPSQGNAANDTVFDGAAGNSMRLYLPNVSNLGLYAGAALSASLGTQDPTIWQRITCRFNGVSSDLAVNGASQASGNVGAANGGGLILGMFGDQISNPSDTRIAEVICYNRVLNATEVAQVDNYLAARYAL